MHKEAQEKTCDKLAFSFDQGFRLKVLAVVFRSTVSLRKYLGNYTPPYPGAKNSCKPCLKWAVQAKTKIRYVIAHNK